MWWKIWQIQLTLENVDTFLRKPFLLRKYISFFTITIRLEVHFVVSLYYMITRNTSFNRNSSFSYKVTFEMLSCHVLNFGGNFAAVFTLAAPGVFPCMGYIGISGPKGYRFSAVLVIKEGSDFSWFSPFFIGQKRYGFCTLSLVWECFKARSHIFIIIEKKINKSYSQIMFTVI